MPRYQEAPLTSLAQGLERESADYIKKLVALLNTGTKPTRKADLIALVCESMQGKKLQSLWSQLDKLQQAAIAEVVHSSSPFYQHDAFVAKYGEAPNWGSSSTYGWNREPSLLCLFFYQDEMPPDLKLALLKIAPKPKPTLIKQAGDSLPETVMIRHEPRYTNLREGRKIIIKEAPLTVCEMERSAPHDLGGILRLIQSGKISVSDKTSLPGAASIKAIAAILQNKDFYDDEQRKQRADAKSYFEEIGAIKAFAWAMLVQAANLVEISNKKLVLSKAGLKALQDPPAKTIQTIWKRWLKTTLLDEFRRIDHIKGQTGKGARSMTAVAGRRAVINTVLTECPVGMWIAFDEFSRFMLATNRRFEVTRSAEHLYISESGYGNLYDSGDWKILQERYMRCLLFEYAATLGIIDVAYIDPGQAEQGFSSFFGAEDFTFLSRYDGLMYFRLNSLGAYCLDLQKEYVPSAIPSRPVLQVLPNLEIVASGEGLTSVDTLVLDLYTEKVSDVVWRLDRQKLFTAQESGHSIDELLDFLTAKSSTALPQTATQFFSDAKERTNSLRDLGTAKLIECNQANLAVLIANDSRTKKFCQLAGDRHLVVLSENETKFRSALRQMGYVIPLSR
ncbi:hypothetical protein V2H45_01430 [Tumidithrix elongata RA019]|uniref:Helicase XPB/Ssl2 N-terminal domain-containing protein n=1 Tax=Tumidithrix elongata BACA0141 TaxID=2716417 RepID=A0AAW9PPU3_9CYAN|nr:hypothetical protein [Tumidithrix elongata RA019]